MAKIQFRIELNKGRIGIPLSKLAKVADEARLFLASLGEDIHLDPQANTWRALDFKNGSVAFAIETAEPITEELSIKGTQALNWVLDLLETPPEAFPEDAPLSSATVEQFAKISNALDADEQVGIVLTPEFGKQRTCTFSKENFAKVIPLTQKITGKLTYIGGIQGVITAFFKEKQPYFKVRDLQSKNLVFCYITQQDYQNAVALLEKKDAMVYVSGVVTLNRATKRIESIQANRFAQTGQLTEEEFNRFFGCAPDLTGSLTTEQYIAKIRENE